jgi:hypothetical protein
VTDSAFLLTKTKNKKMKEWQKWVSGLWFERLISHWLTGQGMFKEAEVVSNVQILDTKRELDFVLLKQNNLYVIEAKVAPSKQDKLNAIIRQMTSINTIGKLKQILAISPHFKKAINSEDAKNHFFDSCDDNAIDIVESREGLMTLLNKLIE